MEPGLFFPLLIGRPRLAISMSQIQNAADKFDVSRVRYVNLGKKYLLAGGSAYRVEIGFEDIIFSLEDVAVDQLFFDVLKTEA